MPAQVQAVQDALLDWYAAHGRDLPWRRTRDPYAILVAEVMLQQTQVERVIPHWHAWLERFPSFAALAAATRADAIRAWQGLGYNLRAVRLHALAGQVVAEHNGILPREIPALMSLTGIGRYTAGAVACFAYEQPVAMVDTNVRRILSRVFGVEPLGVEAMADAVVPRGAAYAWNQALMELGQTLCRTSQPLCLVCPLVSLCGGPRHAPPALRRSVNFRGSSRYYRGRVVDALRALPAGASLPLADLAAQIDDRAELIEALAADGLVSIDADRGVRLAD